VSALRLTNVMVDLEEGTASLGLFGEVGADGARPPHVQIGVAVSATGEAPAIRAAAVEAALDALDDARKALEAAR
ncbi:MAG: hypothetical protein AAF322_02555, partial [Pseudomonadota bacterium]